MATKPQQKEIKVDVTFEVTDPVTFKTKKVRFTSPGKLADALYEMNKARLAVAKQAKIFEEEQSKVEAWFIDNLGKSTTGLRGEVGSVSIVTKEVPIIDNEEQDGWDLFYKFVRKNDRFDLMQRRLNAQAVAEMWALKKTVPGVGKMESKKVSITKA